MRAIFAGDPLPKSIFLAGPTPRSADVLSWRPHALALLEIMDFEGDVLVPERDDWTALRAYEDQIHWEWEGLNLCTQAVFWIPRELIDMPGFTTNIEYGLLAASGKVVLGFPKDAPKMRYLETLAKKHSIPIAHTLQETLRVAVERCGQNFGSW